MEAKGRIGAVGKITCGEVVHLLFFLYFLFLFCIFHFFGLKFF